MEYMVKIVVDSILPNAEFGPNDHPVDAPHFRIITKTIIAKTVITPTEKSSKPCAVIPGHAFVAKPPERQNANPYWPVFYIRLY